MSAWRKHEELEGHDAADLDAPVSSCHAMESQKAAMDCGRSSSKPARLRVEPMPIPSQACCSISMALSVSP